MARPIAEEDSVVEGGEKPLDPAAEKVRRKLIRFMIVNLGLLFLEQRNYDLAIDNFKAALGGDLSPVWLSVWSNIKMGNAYDAKGDRTRAVAAYKRAQNLGDNYDNAQDSVKKFMATPYDPKDNKTTASK